MLKIKRERLRLEGRALLLWSDCAAGTVVAAMRKDNVETVRHILLAADQGHAGAQTNCGTMFEYGLGIPKDRAESIRWYRLAAAQGVAYATASLRRLRA